MRDWQRMGNPFMGLDSGERDRETGNEWLEMKERQRKFQEDRIYMFGPKPPPEPYELPSHGRGYITQRQR